MENDGLFAAEVDADAHTKSTRSRENGRTHNARNSSINKLPTHSEDQTDEENAPLLHERAERHSLDSESSREEAEWTGNAGFSNLPWWKRPSIFWLLPSFLLFTTAFGVIIVPKLNLIIELICHDFYAEKTNTGTSPIPILSGEPPLQCQTPEISSRVSLFNLYGNLCAGLLSAITSPKLGALSDRYGRKKLLIFTTSGMLVSEVLTILAAKYPNTVHVNWILVGFSLDGLCGSFIVGMALAHAYATDCTSPQKRNVAFAYFHACLFTGIAVGPFIAGRIIKATGTPLSVFYGALGCHVIFILFLLFFIPESLSKARQLAAREKYRREMEELGPSSDWINQLRSINLLAPLKILYPTGPGSSTPLRRNLILLAAIDTITFSVAMGATGVVIIYTNLQFGWGNLESTRFVSIVNSCRVFVLLIALPLVTRLVRGREGTSRQRNTGSDVFDLSVIRFAIFFDIVGYLGYTLARQGSWFTLAGALASAGGVGSPALGSALTKHVPAERVGQLLGATGLLHAVARVLGPTIFNGIYYATVGSFRQTVFVSLTATFGLAFICTWFLRPHIYLDDPEVEGSEEDGTSTH